MSRQFKTTSNTIKIPKTDKPNIVAAIFSLFVFAVIIILLPLIVIVCLCVKLFQIFNTAFSQKEDANTSGYIEGQNAEEITGPIPESPGALLLTQQNLKIYMSFAGEIRFGPPYFFLRAEPLISAFQDQIYGNWFFCSEAGVFIQQWNSTTTPDTDLIFIDSTSLEVQVVLKHIPSVMWEMTKDDATILQLKCTTPKEVFKYALEAY